MFPVEDWLVMVDNPKYQELTDLLKTEEYNEEVHEDVVSVLYLMMLLTRPARASEPLTVSLNEIQKSVSLGQRIVYFLAGISVVNLKKNFFRYT